MSITFIDILKPAFAGKLIDEEDVNFPGLTISNRIVFWDGTKFEESPIYADSNIGIFTDSPQANLHSNSTSNINTLKLTNSVTGSGLNDGLDITINSDEDVTIKNNETGKNINLVTDNGDVDITGTLLEYITKETRTGDEGINISGELHVGNYNAGKESVFGEGDSHTSGMKVFSTTDGIVFTDNTVKASSPDGDTFAPFDNGLAPGAIFYIGSDLILCGIKIKNDVLIDPGTGIIVREYWDGTSWELFTALATDSDYPYAQRADNIGTIVGSEQVRFGSCDDQIKTIVNGENKYWVRFRITSAITSDGQVDLVKLHTNRFEINANGFTEYYGNSIYKNDLTMHWHLTETLSGFSPQNQTISFASGIELVYTTNKLNNNQTSGKGGYIVIPEGMDTSKNLEYSILWMPLDNTAGDILFNLDTYQTKVGDILTVANTPNLTQEVTPIALTSQSMMYKTTLIVNIQNLLPGEILAFGIKRVGGDILDTYSSDIALINIRATGFFWKP